MTHFGAILDGLARHLETQGMGVYRADGVFSPDQRGITVSAFPETPREIVALTLYLPEFTRTSPTAERQLTAASIQVKYRLLGHPLAGIEYFDQLMAVLHDKHIDLGQVNAHTSYQSYTPLGQVNNAAWVFSTNWRISSLRAL